MPKTKTQSTGVALGLVNIFNPNLDMVHRGVMNKITTSETGKPDSVNYEIRNTPVQVFLFGSGASIYETILDAYWQAKENGNTLLLDVEIINFLMTEFNEKSKQANASTDGQQTTSSKPTK